MAPNKTTRMQKFTGWLPYLIAGLFVLGIVLIVLFGNMAGPIASVKNAALKTAFSENFTAQFQFDINSSVYDGVLNAALDRDARDMQLYLQFQTNESDYICGIFKKTFALCKVSTNQLSTKDATAQINGFFDALDSGAEPDWATLLDFGDWNLHEEISGDFDFPVFMECLRAFLEKLDDADWATGYAGYHKSKESGITYHNFQPKLYPLAQTVVPDFRAAFKDPARYDALTNYVENAQHLLNAGKADFSFGVKGRQLVSAAMDIRYHNTRIQCDITFLGINTTQVDYDTIAFFIEEANKTPDERFEDFMDPVIPY